MEKAITTAEGVNLVAVQKLHERVYQRIYMNFMQFVEDCEAKHSNIVPANGSELLTDLWNYGNIGVPESSPHNSLQQLHQMVVSWGYKENDSKASAKKSHFNIADETCHVEFKRNFTEERSVAVAEDPAFRTFKIDVFMEMHWDIEKGKPYTIMNYSCRVKTVETIYDDRGTHVLGTMTNFDRTNACACPNAFVIYPHNAAFVLAVQMMFVKSQLCTILKNNVLRRNDAIVTALGQVNPEQMKALNADIQAIEDWHLQWFRSSIWEIEIYDAGHDITNKYLREDTKTKIVVRAFYRRLWGMLMELMTSPIPVDKLDSMEQLHIRRVNTTPMFVHANDVTSITANYYSDKGGGIFPTITIYDDYKNADTMFVIIQEYDHHGANIEVCYNKEHRTIENNYRSLTITIPNLHTTEAAPERCEESVERIIEAYIGILYAQYSNLFGNECAITFEEFQRDRAKEAISDSGDKVTDTNPDDFGEDV